MITVQQVNGKCDSKLAITLGKTRKEARLRTQMNRSEGERNGSLPKP